MKSAIAASPSQPPEHALRLPEIEVLVEYLPDWGHWFAVVNGIDDTTFCACQPLSAIVGALGRYVA